MAKLFSNLISGNSKEPKVSTNFSADLSDWLTCYCQAILQAEEFSPGQSVPARFVNLQFEPEGDYTAQIAQLASNRTPAPLAGQELAAILRRNPYNLLLGAAGSGKTFQLQSLVYQQARQLLARLQASEQTLAERSQPLDLPIYLDLGKIETAPGELEKINARPNYFQNLLDSHLKQLVHLPLPGQFFSRVAPLLFLDNLELLGPAFAPHLLYRLNHWLNQTGAKAHIIISSRHLNFPLYHPWFKAEQNWQVYAVPGLDWAALRASLPTRLPTEIPDRLELAGLTGLLTHPVLHRLTLGDGLLADATTDQLAGLLQNFLDQTFGGQPEFALFLARLSSLLDDELPPPAKTEVRAALAIRPVNKVSHFTRQVWVNPPQATARFEARALTLGLVEKHPVTGRLQLVNPALDNLLAGWYCLQLDSAALSQTLGRMQLVTRANRNDHQLIGNFLRLLYLLFSPVQRQTLFTTLLQPNPTPAGLGLALKLGELETDFAATWQAYLAALPDDKFKRELLRLCAGLGQRLTGIATPPWLSEMALQLLVEHDPADARLHLALGRVQEATGRASQALFSYHKAQQVADLPALESTLKLAEIATRQGQYDQAATPLLELHRRLQTAQAEVANQLAVVRRGQGQPEAAWQFARQAVALDRQPAYRLNLALSLYDKGAKTEAEAELVNLTSEQSDFAEAFCDLGRLQLERGAYEAALLNLQKAVELKPTAARFLYSLGNSLAAAGRYPEAYSYLRAASDQREATSDYDAALGVAAFRLGRLDEARAALERAISRISHEHTNPPPSGLLVYLAATEFAATNYAGASNALTIALDHAPDNIQLRLLAGRVAEAAGRLDPAMTHYQQAAGSIRAMSRANGGANVPTEILATCQLGLARNMRLRKRLAEADHHLQAVRLFQPDEPETWQEAGELALACQDYQVAAESFAKGRAALSKNKNVAKGGVSALLSLDSDWLGLFGSAEKLAFDLARHHAAALMYLGQSGPAQQILESQLEILSTSESESGDTNPVTDSRRAALRHQLGLSLLDTDQPEPALEHLRQAVIIAPQKVEYRLALVKTLLANQQTENALTELEQVRLQSADSDPTVCAEVARLLLLARPDSLDATRLLDSLNLYLKALEAEAENPAYLYQAGLLAYHLRYQNQATALIERLLLTAPDLRQTRLLAACNLERSGELALARLEIEKGLAIGDPGPAKTGLAATFYPQPLEDSLYLVAVRLYRKLDMSEQMAQALGKFRDLQGPLALQAAILAEQGWLAMSRQVYANAARFYGQAVAALRQVQAAETKPGLGELYIEANIFDEEGPSQLLAENGLAYARALSHAGQPQTALGELDEAIRLRPQYPAAHLLRGKLLKREGALAAALESFQQAARLESTPALQYELGLLYLKLKEVEPAIAAFKQAAVSREIANHSEYYANLGLAYQLAGKNGLARAAFARALQLDPHNPQLHQAVARCYLEEGEPMSAVQPLQEAVVCEPANPLYRLELAQLYEELGWLQDAAQEYEQLTRLAEHDPLTWLRSGQLLAKIGKTGQALGALQHALALEPDLAEAHYEIGRLYLTAHQTKLSAQEKLPPDMQGMFVEMKGEAASRAMG